MNQRQIPFTQHVIENPHIFSQNDTYFICSYIILNKVRIQLIDTWLVDEEGMLYKIKPKHWIVSLMDRFITNKNSVSKNMLKDIGINPQTNQKCDLGYLKFDYNGPRITFIEKPDEELFTIKKLKPKRSKKPVIDDELIDEIENEEMKDDFEKPKKKYVQYETE